MKTGFSSLEEVIQDELFPELDLALRHGRHIDSEEGARFELLAEAQWLLEGFYARYGWELARASAGYFFLVPQHERLQRRTLSTGEMMVGQALALLYLDPNTLETAGTATRSQVIELLVHLVGEERLYLELHPRRRKLDERVAQEAIRREIERSLRQLAVMGFCELADEERVRLKAPLMRFAEPVASLEAPSEALAKLVAKGHVALVETEEEEG